MERHKCRLCWKKFSNGRALGGHMRSHLLNHPIPSKQEQELAIQLGEETESASSSDEEAEAKQGRAGEEEEEEKGGLYYGLRENPKRSIRLVDPEFSFAVDAASEVVLQDRESETESPRNPTRIPFKRVRKLVENNQQHHRKQIQELENNAKKLNCHKLSNKTESSWAEPEPVSSISDTTSEEDVAFCLMLLSRDKWKRKEQHNNQEEQEEEEEAQAEKSEEETDESEELRACKTRIRRRYKCETCNKVFKSYQALGGHRASHKKLKVFTTPPKKPCLEPENAARFSSILAEKKIHECPYCFRVFSSGQALGGHKRSHLTGLAASSAAGSSGKFGDNLNLIDLNLPAPLEDDDASQIELSAVSDAEFVTNIRR